MHRFLNIQQNIKLRNYHQLLLYFVTAAAGRSGRAEVSGRGRSGRSRSRRVGAAAEAGGKAAGENNVNAT